MPRSHILLFGDLTSRLRSWLVSPLSVWWCATSWVASTAIFVGIVELLGGPAPIDSQESIFSTWAIQHGQWACSFPLRPVGQPLTAPVYPLLSGAVAAVARVGGSTAFPVLPVKGHQCAAPYGLLSAWAIRSGATLPTRDIAFLGWLILMIGIIVWLRASGRGRTGWEPVTLLVVACLPPVWMCIDGFFHPQDLVALGLSLCAIACGKKDRWAEAGVFIALAFLSQQFALLLALPLLVLAPGQRKVRYVGAALAAAVVIVVPLLLVTRGSALSAVGFGSGDTTGIGTTVVSSLHLHGASTVLVSRVLPVVLSVALAVWVINRLGAREARAPVAMLSLLATSLALRLVFEVNIYVYYFMALAVFLLLLDVQRGRLRASFVAWLTCLTLVFAVGWGYNAFHYVTWQYGALTYIPPLVVGAALALFVLQLFRGASRWSLSLLGCVLVVGLVTWHAAGNLFYVDLPIWLTQVGFTASGLALAAEPLRTALRVPTPERVDVGVAGRDGSDPIGVRGGQ